jgi:hypothetical protein
VNATPAITFTPAQVALKAGGTVTFLFGNVPHNVFFDNHPAGAPATIDGANTNVSVQRSFPVAGTYNYYCHIHPGMRGTIVVGAVTDPTTRGQSAHPRGTWGSNDGIARWDRTGDAVRDDHSLCGQPLRLVQVHDAHEVIFGRTLLSASHTAPAVEFLDALSPRDFDRPELAV